MSSGEAARHADGDLPGNPMMWVLIASEIAVFGLALAGFQLARVFDPELFAASQARLDEAIELAEEGIDVLPLPDLPDEHN